MLRVSYKHLFGLKLRAGYQKPHSPVGGGKVGFTHAQTSGHEFTLVPNLTLKTYEHINIQMHRLVLLRCVT